MSARILFVAACMFATVACASPKQLTVDPPLAKQLRELIRQAGHECQELKTLYFIGTDPRGTIMRALCGAPGGPAVDAPSFRLHATQSGALSIAPWQDGGK